MRLRDTKPELMRRTEPLYRMLMNGELPIYVLGTNETGRKLADVLSSLSRAPEAFVNDCESIAQFCGRPVTRTSDLPHKAIVVSCSTAVRPVEALRRLESASIEYVLDYFSLYLLGNGHFPAPKFCTENISDIESNWAKYEWLETLLADDISKSTLRRLIEFRYNFDLAPMAEFQTRLETQYFEPFVPLAGAQRFVDGGGFDGKTTETFVQKCPHHSRVDYVEPDPLLMLSSKKRLGRFERIHYHETALSDRSGEAHFQQTGTGSGAIRKTGNLRVRTSRLDDLMAEAPTFVKLDIEGAEVSALAGAARIISGSHPALAVCVYHRQSDFWRVPEKVLSLHPAYTVFLLHYTEGVEETVMYFVHA